MKTILQCISFVNLLKVCVFQFGLIGIFMVFMVFSVEATEKEALKSTDLIEKVEKTDWISLFDGKTMKGWKASDFAGQGEVEIRDDSLHLGMGASLTGISTTRKDLPTTNYEVELKAMRVDGFDFFCALPFQVGKEPCSLIIGGWGGGVIGLSSIDGFDASENPTTSYRNFDEKKWYQIRLKVTDAKIEAWIDAEQVVDVTREGKKFSIRPEVDPSLPFGVASYSTKAAIKDFRLRRLN
ncbi:MAG TPA: DUF1080 domain-containing protein [Verrucomicrobiales bacterium]|nr:DUF1080 domain-containing protein [Verrucomicrobiales bacterium]